MLRALAPYRILLVDAEEGFRMMAHGANDLAIGDPVTARFQAFGPLLIPFFERREIVSTASSAPIQKP
jgi:hypothetical protein